MRKPLQDRQRNTAAISGLATFTYDGFNRLATSITAAETTTYTYNALGERMKNAQDRGQVFHYHIPNATLRPWRAL